MKKAKSALKYFARLIEFEGLLEERNEFHSECARRAAADKSVRYDLERETIEYEHFDFSTPSTIISRNFGQELCSTVKKKTLKSKEIVYERSTSGFKTERELFYRQIMRDLDKWGGIVAKEPMYLLYPCVGAALLEVKEYAATYNPFPADQGASVTARKPEEYKIGFYYRYSEAGVKPDRASALTLRCLGNLYDAYKDDLKLIAPETRLEDFRIVFSGKIVATPIRWIGTYSQLNHFIKSIEPKLATPGSKRVPRKWEIAAGCFVGRNGEKLLGSQLMSTGIRVKDVDKGGEMTEAAKLLR